MPRRVLLACGGAAATLGLALLVPPQWPRQVAILVENDTGDTLLVDARWWGGPVGIAGPLAVRLAPGATTRVLHPGRREVCFRGIDPHTGRLTGGLVATGLTDDTLRVVALGPSSTGPAGAPFSAVCPPELADDRVRVALGRYFDPAEPGRIRRERLIRRYRTVRVGTSS